jgi:CRISPR-associated protein Csd2
MNAAHLDPARRHDAVLLFEVTDGNPNGDPDAGNLPRVDPETMQGLVSDVAIKRKIRNWVEAYQGGADGYRIYVQSETPLNELHQEAYDARQIASKGSRQARDQVKSARDWMCEQFFDIRTFGAVMSTGVNAGQVRGPVQITFSRSIDPIIPMEVAITRTAITRGEDLRGADGEGGKSTEIGRKALVPYGLYRGSVFVTPKFASDTGFSSEDLDLVWRALVNMWDLDHSAARGTMACRGLFVFTHDHPLGNAPAHRLFDLVTVSRSGDGPPRQFSDYEVQINESAIPEGVTLTRL